RLVPRRRGAGVRLRDKLLLAQLPLALSLVMAGAVSRRTVEALDRQSQEILKDNYLSVLAAQHMRDAADAMAPAAPHHAPERGALDAGGAAAVARSRATFERELRFQEGNIPEEGEREMTGRLRRAWSDFQRDYERTMDASGQKAESRYFEWLEPELVALTAS